MSGECLRSDLLWALELLAWNPAHFARVARIVFDLQRFEINDSWSNTPAETARSLFRAWYPATILNVSDKMQILRQLAEQYRLPAMEVCFSLLPDDGYGFASDTTKPRWRALDQDFLQPTDNDVMEASTEASRLLLDLGPFDKIELRKIVENLTRLHPTDLDRLVREVQRWAEEATEDEKAELRNTLRRRDVTRAYQDDTDGEELVEAINSMKLVLEPQNATARHRWLFDDGAIEWRSLVEEEENNELSWQEREARIEKRQGEAIADIRDESGEEALYSFACSVNRPERVAQILVPVGAATSTASKWVKQALLGEPSEQSQFFSAEDSLERWPE